MAENEPYSIDFYEELMGSLHVEVTKEVVYDSMDMPVEEKYYITKVTTNDFTFENDNETLEFRFTLENTV